MTKLHSTRFGLLEVSDESVLEFPEGLIGLPGRRYALLGHDASTAFHWLHCLDDPELALPVCNPWNFFPEYVVELSDEDADRLGIDEPQQASVLVTVRAASDPGACTANLRAPILLLGDTGHQVINQADDAPLRAALFAASSAAAA